MRHTVSLSGSNQIKGQRIFSKKLPNIPDESIVKIQQSNNKIYAIYSSVDNNKKKTSSQGSQISLKYLQLNLIQEGLVSLSKVPTPIKLKQIQIQLSAIDYQLVNNNFGLLETSFLDQVNVVWAGARIPLYYNEHNSVTLVPRVQALYLIDPYAAVSFSLKSQDAEQPHNTQHHDQDIQQKQQLGQKLLILQKTEEHTKVTFGYDNIIQLGHDDYQYLEAFRAKEKSNCRAFFCTVQPLLPFVTAPTFQQFLAFRKLQINGHIPELKPLLVQLHQYRPQPPRQLSGSPADTTEKVKLSLSQQEISYRCSSICRSSLGLTEKLMISEQLINSFQISSTLSLQMFLKQVKESRFRISIQPVGRSTDKMSRQIQHKTKTRFCQLFLQSMRIKKEFVFLQNYYPFFIDGQIHAVTISKSTSNNCFQPLKTFLLVRNNFISNQIVDDQQFMGNIMKSLLQGVQVRNNQNPELLSKWLPLVKCLAQKQNRDQPNSQKQQFSRIFSLCYQKQLAESIQFIKNQLSKGNSSAKMLFTTYSSNGKTYLYEYFKNLTYEERYRPNEKSCSSWYLDLRSLSHASNVFSQIKQYLNSFVSMCPYKLLFLDNVQTMLPKVQQGDQMRQKQRVISHVLGKFLIKLLDSHQKIGIFTSKSQTNIDPVLRFSLIVKLKNPSRHTRAYIVKSLNLQETQSLGEQLVDKTQSFSLGSFAKYLIDRQIPTKKLSRKNNDFSRIVGLKQAKNMIKSVIQKPNKYGFIYEKVKIKVPRGILLYGATGNGKTALGHSVEEQFAMKFFTVKGSDILSKYIGGSQAAVRQIFEKALSVSPSIIFFDQFQSIVPRRNSSGTGVTDRVVNQFLCYLDGVSSTTGVFIIAASSRPDLIDPALLRPGRIDSHIYLQYPNEEQRIQLLTMFQNSIKLQIEVDEFVASTQNYSYSDLIGLLKQLRIKKSAQVLKLIQNPKTEQFKTISQDLFRDTINSYRIGTQVQEQKIQQQLFQRFKHGKGPEVKKQKFIQM